MACIKKHGKNWRAQIYVKGVRDSIVKPTRQEAAQWALEREAELNGKKPSEHIFADAINRFAQEVSPNRNGFRWEIIRLNAFLRHEIVQRRIAALGPEDFIQWRDSRLKEVKPATVAREMNLLSSILETAIREWRWIKKNPMKEVKWPRSPKGRARRITDKEVEELAKAFDVWNDLRAETATHRVGLAFLFALETAMRSGEILALTWPNIYLAEQYAHLPNTKNGDARDVPLSRRACEILSALPRCAGPVFQLRDEVRDALWRKIRDKTRCRDIHFHDSRAEAIWRLSKKVDVLQLARIIGHRDLKSLMIYYNESASSLAKMLG